MKSASYSTRRELYPAWFTGELPEISRISKGLMRKRIPSMYGEETLGVRKLLLARVKFIINKEEA